MGTGGRSVLARFASTSVGSTVTSFLALFIARFPTLLGPVHTIFPVGSAASRVPSSSTGSIIRLFRPGSLAGFGGVALAVVVAALKITSGMTLTPFVATHLAHPKASTPGLNNSTSGPLFYPYLVTPSLYPVPDNLSLSDNASLPLLGSSILGAVPIFFLLTTDNNASTGQLLLQSGTYSPDLAGAILNGTTCSGSGHGHGKGHPTNCTSPPNVAISWSIPAVVTNFSSPVLGDALAVNGTELLVAAASAGFTSLYLSVNAGGNWSQMAVVSGDNPQLSLNGDHALLTTLGSGSLQVATLSLSTGVLQTAALPAAISASPVILGNGALGVVASAPNSSVVYYSSIDGGVSYSTGILSTYATNSTSPIFNRIGQTSLSMPGGIPGQVTAIAEGGDGVWALFTTSISGLVMAATVVSGDGGRTWQGPYLSGGGTGTILDPVAVASPVGYVYASWLENGGSGWHVYQAVYGADGRLLQPAAPVPNQAGTIPSGGPTLAVDALLRPLYAWPVSEPPTGRVLFTGDYLQPAQAAQAWSDAVENLTAADFVNGSANDSTSLLDKLGALEHQVEAGAYHGALLKVEQDLYPKVTSLPLTLLCTEGNRQCGHVHLGTNSPWIANQTGLMVANTFLAVYADWMLEALGIGILTPLPGDASESLNGATLSVLPQAFDPTTGVLGLSSTFPANVLSMHFITGYCNGPPSKDARTVETQDVNDQTTYTVYDMTTMASTSFDAPAGTAPSVYLTDLSANAENPWGVSVVGHYTEVQTTKDDCTGASTTIPLGSTTFTMSLPILQDNLSTAFHILHNPPVILNLNLNPSIGDIAFHWNTTLARSLYDEVNLTGLPSQSANDLQTPEVDMVVPNVPFGTYTASGWSESYAGGSTTVGTPSLDFGSSYSSPPYLHDSFSCPLTLGTSPITLWGLSASVAGSTATVTWYSNLGPSEQSMDYYEFGTSSNRTQSGMQPIATNLYGNGTNEYQEEFSGLSTFSSFSVTVTSTLFTTTGSCLSYQRVLSSTFSTPSVIALQQHELSYDSISQEGGGEEIYWNLPTLPGTPPSFNSGFLSYSAVGGTGGATLVPLLSLSHMGPGHLSVGVNLSVLTPGTSYRVNVVLNYTHLGGPLTVTSEPFVFTYLQDSSGDGLADSEKGYGWSVTYTDASGVYHIDPESADSGSYATNGLVSDYVEKEFGLNPHTVDTAGSHMLDTWNLTFSLPSVSCPSGFIANFECWDESGNSQFDPFNYAQTPQGFAPGNPTGSAPGNFSQGTAGFNGPDSSPWGADQLWTSKDLQTLQGLMANEQVGWLRGVLSDAPGVGPAFTVWGKLSWGANPLATSTPGDGIPDGARVNPLHEVDLEVGIVDGAGMINVKQLSDGMGFALRFYVNQTSQGGAPVIAGDYSNQAYVCADSNCDPTLPRVIVSPSPDINEANYYALTTPIPQTVQFEHLDMQMILNSATCKPSDPSCTSPYVLSEVPINSCATTYQVGSDMVSPLSLYGSFSGQYNIMGTANCKGALGGAFGSVDFGVTAVSSGVKYTTYLWTPNDNSTLSSLPLGLKRYAGEQSFVMVQANLAQKPGQVTCQGCQFSMSSDKVPYADVGSYTVTGTGVINFLIPRSQFMGSPLGKAVLLGQPGPNASLSGPLLQDASSEIGGASISNLECYWQNLAVYSNPSLCSGAGTPAGSFDSVQVVGDTETCTVSSTTPDCKDGGVGSNPNLGDYTPALLAVITLNLTENEPATLDALLAGLLDNSTGGPNGVGLNGSFTDVTSFLPTLGLVKPVMSALMNQVELNGGIYGAPESVALPPPPPPPPPSPSCSGFGCLWNAVTSTVESIAGVVASIGATVWGYAVAAVTYTMQLYTGLSSYVAKGSQWLAATTVSDLQKIGAAVVQALLALLTAILQLIQSLLTEAVSPIATSMKSAEVSELGQMSSLAIAQQDYSSGTGGLGAFTSNMGDTENSLMPFAASLTTAVTIVVGITVPFTLGASAVVGILVPVLITAFSVSNPGTGTPSVGGLGGLAISLLTGSGLNAIWVNAMDVLLNLTLSGVTGARTLINAVDVTAVAATSASLGVALIFAFKDRAHPIIAFLSMLAAMEAFFAGLALAFAPGAPLICSPGNAKAVNETAVFALGGGLFGATGALVAALTGGGADTVTIILGIIGIAAGIAGAAMGLIEADNIHTECGF